MSRSRNECGVSHKLKQSTFIEQLLKKCTTLNMYVYCIGEDSQGKITKQISKNASYSPQIYISERNQIPKIFVSLSKNLRK